MPTQPTPPLPPGLSDSDPYTEMYRAIRGILLATPGLINTGTVQQKTGLIQPGNFIDYTLHNLGNLPGRDEAGAPDLTLLPTRDKYSPKGRNTLVSSLVQSFVIATSSKRTSVAMEINPVKWAILKAMAAAPLNLGLSYVTGWEGTDGGDEITRADYASDPPSRIWRSVLGITVYADISRAMLGLT